MKLQLKIFLFFVCWFCLVVLLLCFPFRSNVACLEFLSKKKSNSVCRCCKHLDDVRGKAFKNAQCSSGILVQLYLLFTMNPFNNSSQIWTLFYNSILSTRHGISFKAVVQLMAAAGPIKYDVCFRCVFLTAHSFRI